MPSLRIFLCFCCFLIAPIMRAEDSTSRRLAQRARSILSQHCYDCHGPDARERQADLRLDTPAGLKRALASGNDGANKLLHRVNSQDPDSQMPPPRAGRPLAAQDIQALESWIKTGGEFTPHWSFVPPRKLATPDGAHPIDHFLNAEIRRRGLTPNPPAAEAAQLRRVALLLTGLPPTREQIERLGSGEFNYEAFVDELLNSTAFGQHFGRYWLDLVRYGDTHGRNLDNYREMWPYRDWVIESFNSNLSFDKFITEQIAGDLLPDATLQQKIASGYNRLNLTTTEVGSIYEEVFAQNVMDRTDAFGTVFLGLTTQCAACHDHKFDPISQRDYYSLSAFFNSLDGNAVDENSRAPAPFVRLPTEAQKRGLTEIQHEIARLRAELSGPIKSVDIAQREWEARIRLGKPPSESSSIVHYGIASFCGPFSAESSYAAFDRHYASELDDYRENESFDHDGKVFHWRSLAGWRPLESSSLPSAGKGTSVNIVHQALFASGLQRAELLVRTNADHQVYLNHTLIADSRRTGSRASATNRYVLQLSRGSNDLYIKTMSGSETELAYAFRTPNVTTPADLVAIAKKASRTMAEHDALRRYFREVVCDHVDWTFPSDLLAGAEATKKKLEDSFATSLIWKELATPRPAHLLKRGRYDQPGEVVDRGVPSFLPPLPSNAPTDRLALARWLTAPNHPLTARVAVNRFWQSLFGVGLVTTSEDFGHQGDLASHPELLDWLAVDLIENGWNTKRLIKQMVTSEAFRRSAKLNQDALSIDPDNRYLARGPRFRMDAEVLRDQALALSGLLNPTLGGPSVKSPQPDGLWESVGYIGSNTAKYRAEVLPQRVFRRSVYLFWKRTSPPPQLSTLDAPSRESCTARRERTNTPMQALLMLNETQYLQACKALAARALTECDSPQTAERVRWLFKTMTAREANEEEVVEMVELVDDLLVHYRANRNAAEELLSIDEEEMREGNDQTQAAWMVLASVILNLDEMVNP